MNFKLNVAHPTLFVGYCPAPQLSLGMAGKSPNSYIARRAERPLERSRWLYAYPKPTFGTFRRVSVRRQKNQPLSADLNSAPTYFSISTLNLTITRSEPLVSPNPGPTLYSMPLENEPHTTGK